MKWLYEWSLNWLSEKLFDASEFMQRRLVGSKAIRAYQKALHSDQIEVVEEARQLMLSRVYGITINESSAENLALRCANQLANKKNKMSDNPIELREGTMLL